MTALTFTLPSGLTLGTTYTVWLEPQPLEPTPVRDQVAAEFARAKATAGKLRRDSKGRFVA